MNKHVEDASQEELKKPSFWQSIGSVLAAAIGVQSDKNRERDFKKGDPATFITIGIVFVIVLLLSVYMVVKTVIANAG